MVVLGPTAGGKTALSLALAKKLGGEIVCADSMQVYRGMDVGTAKPTRAERREVPHHLVDFLSPKEPFSAARYAELARKAVAGVNARGRLPILVGGTGLYIQAIVDNILFEPMPSDPRLRRELERRAGELGGQALLEELAKVDPGLAEKLHPNNLGRIIRGLEAYRLTGTPLSRWQERSRREPSPYNPCMLGIAFRDRQALYRRIEERVEDMLAKGLVEEAERLYSGGYGRTAVQAIGYKELFGFFRGEQDLAQAVAQIKQETRRYAKRQMTWFRRDKRVHWLYADAGDHGVLREALRIVGDCFPENRWTETDFGDTPG